MQNEPALEYAVEETDMTVIELTDEEKALWVEKVTPLQETYTEKVRDLVDTDVMDYIKSLADKYNAIYP